MTPMPPSKRTRRSRSWSDRKSRSCAVTGASRLKATAIPTTTFIIGRTLVVVVRLLPRTFPRSKAGLFKFSGQRHAERLASARQTRHHGADRNIQRVRQLAVRKPLELAPHEQLTEAIRQRPQCVLDQPAVVGAERQRFWIRGTLGGAV